MLAQAVFAALPTKDSPEANLYQPTLLSQLKDYLTSRNMVYAQEKTMNEEEFKKLMERDLQNVVNSLPKGNVEEEIYKIWCTSSAEAPIGNESRPPDYTTTDSEWVKCGSESLK